MNLWSISFQYWNIVFVNKKVISSPNYYPPLLSNLSSPIVMDDSNIPECFHQLEKGQNVIVECYQPLREIVKYCMSNYRYVKAAGGVVVTPNEKRLLIYRNERWDLPKGKVEAGETLKIAAMREVEEEAGIHNLSIDNLLTKTYHIFNLYGGWHLKQTSWFMMRIPEEQTIVAQEEEGITSGEWVTPEEYRSRLSASYATLKKLIF